MRREFKTGRASELDGRDGRVKWFFGVGGEERFGWGQVRGLVRFVR